MEVNKKRWLCGGTAAALALALAVAGIVCWFRSSRVPPPKTSIRIGVALYRGDDTFISTVRAALEERAKAYEQETGIKVVMDIVDAKLNQNTQNSQVERFISLGYDALCVNIVDRSAASIIIDRAMDAGIPVVFFNREPVEEDMNRWEKLYYIGADAKESAVLQGNILVDAYKKDIQLWDHRDVELDPQDCGLNASPTQVFRSFTPPQKGKGEMLSGTVGDMAGMLVEKLVEKHLV